MSELFWLLTRAGTPSHHVRLIDGALERLNELIALRKSSDSATSGNYLEKKSEYIVKR